MNKSEHGGFRDYLRSKVEAILSKSLQKASSKQGLDKLADKLKQIVPDISSQYSSFNLDNLYRLRKARIQHAFQISLVSAFLEKFESPVIADIGDSSGTHLQYIMGLFGKNKSIKCVSVNIDEEAVKRIKAKGLEAVCARAEEVGSLNIDADIFLCFEVLEHLMDPCSFLHGLSTKTKVKYLVVTVPYLKRSRVGLHHIRANRQSDMSAENTHLFELSPQDWKLIMQHSGWKVLEEKIYWQYPKTGILSLTRALWRKFDFEGFYGMVLAKDDMWSSRYLHWH